MAIKLDILVMAAHPDDAELSCSGTILSYIALGKKVGIVDFTRGEMGTRGTPEIRLQESNEATKILGLHARENLGLADGFFQNDQASQLILMEVIRRYRPEIVLANALEDRHPDHGKGAKLAIDACFLAGQPKEVKALTLKEYSIMEVAQFEKKCETQDLIRSLRSDIINFGGMGVKKMVTPQELMPLPLIDNEYIVLPIRSVDEALKLLESFR